MYIIYIYIFINIYICLCIYIYIYIFNIYIYIYIHSHVLRPPQDSSVWLGLTNREQRTSDVTRVLKAPVAELCQIACGVVKKQKIFCSHQCSPECSINKFRTYISTDTCFVLSRTRQCGSG